MTYFFWVISNENDTIEIGCTEGITVGYSELFHRHKIQDLRFTVNQSSLDESTELRNSRSIETLSSLASQGVI